MVCCSSSPCRIGSLGDRAKRCPEHLFLAPHDVGVRELCARASAEPICSDRWVFLIRPDGETDAGDAALCIAADRRLATPPVDAHGMETISRPTLCCPT